ncbi:MFS transporter [Streptomyces somaliensis]|uniref:MDR family MFS transporter n=1 Tax=Streptomyces somaliensis TaxID=78355 RepID=UPI0020CE0BA2|nr:MFS transporter [Streptomyces somaliensis]MCP9946608.1 MFS transporter [Streptomyces somaliensis]MCP9960254.1 MFS transporter [Streptomyces somaliensis]
MRGAARRGSDRLTKALRGALGGLPRPYWWLWAGTLITSAGGFVLPFLAIYLTSELGYSVSFTGLTLAVFGIGSGIASLLGGILADRLGRRVVLLSSEVLTVTGMVGLGVAHTKALVLAGALVVGVGLNAARPARAAAVADLVGRADLPRAYSLNYWATNLGFSAAAVAAGMAAEHGFLTLFVVNALANLVAGIMIYRWVPETRPEAAGGGTGSTARPNGSVRRDRPFLVLLGSVLLLGLVFQQPLVALPLTMTADGLSPADYGTAMMMNGLVIAVFQLPLSRLAGRIRPEFALGAATVVTGVGMGLTPFVHSLPGYAGTVVLWSLGEIVVWPTCMALVAAVAPPNNQGGYQGWFLSVWSLSVALAPLLSGQLMQMSGTAAVWVVCLSLSLVAAAAHLLLARLRRAERSPRSPRGPTRL